MPTLAAVRRSFLRPAVRLCPAGTPENSPAIYRWVNGPPNPPRPGGAKEPAEQRARRLSSLTGLVAYAQQDPPMNRWATFFRPIGLRQWPSLRQFVAHFSTPPLPFVPQGRPKITQRFIAGLACLQTSQAPEGRKNPRNNARDFFRP